jgi:hypothetical protein
MAPFRKFLAPAHFDCLRTVSVCVTECGRCPTCGARVRLRFLSIGVLWHAWLQPHMAMSSN